MSRATRRGVLLLVFGVLGVSGFALAATSTKRATSCTARPGSTLLQNGSARIYRWRGSVLACTLPSGAPSRLIVDPPGSPPESSLPGGVQIKDISLAGGFVGFRQSDEFATAIGVVDLHTHRSRTVTYMANGGTSQIGGFVSNSHGTVVWILQEPSICSCSSAEKLTENTIAHGVTVLDQPDNETNDRNKPTTAPIPFGSLGLSQSGTIAYWVDNGQAHSADIF